MCAWCRQVRSDEGYWEGLESYITKQAKAQFTHGICPSCRAKLGKTAGLPEADAKAEGPAEEKGGAWPGPRDPKLDSF